MKIIIHLVEKFLGIVTQSRKVTLNADPKDGLVKVNLGCGLRVASGWLNIDGSINALVASWSSFFHRLLYRFSGSRFYYSADEYCEILGNNSFLFHDLSRSLPLYNNSVDFIYSSHFLEHLFKDDAARLLRYCAFALKPNGIIRITIPDLAYAISLYREGRQVEMLQDYFFVQGRESYLARHKYMYDFQMIKEALEEAGFAEVRRLNYQQGKTPDLAMLDIYPEETLFVEATRINY